MVELVLVLTSTTSPDSFSPSVSADYLLEMCSYLSALLV